MTTYRAIAATEYAPDAPVTSEWGEATALNPLAIAEGAAGGPIVAAGWHPYNAVTVGDGNDGLIYDGAVDGAVATVTSPDFADGYEYLFLMDAITANLSSDLQINLFRSTTAAYAGAMIIAGDGSPCSATCNVIYPRRAQFYHLVPYFSTIATGNGVNPVGGVSGQNFVMHAAAATILRAQFSRSSGNITAGKIFMHRRLDYMP